MRCTSILLLPLLGLVACQPQEAGERVGQSLYKASVDTGQAIATVGNKTGEALEHAGNSLRSAPDPQPVTPPTFYAPPGYSAQPGYYPQPDDAAPSTPIRPQMGY